MLGICKKQSKGIISTNFVPPYAQILPAWVEYRASAGVGKLRGSCCKIIPDQLLEADSRVNKPLSSFLTVRDVAVHFQISEKTIRRLIKAGDLPVVRLGRSVRINPEVIEKIVRRNE
jgi:excisionase family DNA binding protein